MKGEKDSVESPLETQPATIEAAHSLPTHLTCLSLMMLNRFVRLTACFGLPPHYTLSNSTFLADTAGDAKAIFEQSGVIDEVRLYFRAVDDAQIAKRFDDESEISSDPVLLNIPPGNER